MAEVRPPNTVIKQPFSLNQSQYGIFDWFGADLCFEVSVQYPLLIIPL